MKSEDWASSGKYEDKFFQESEGYRVGDPISISSIREDFYMLSPVADTFGLCDFGTKTLFGINVKSTC